MDLIELEKSKIIIENLKSIVSLIDDNYINDLLILYKSKIDNFNNSNFTVSDLTKIEIGKFKGVSKNIVKNNFSFNYKNRNWGTVVKLCDYCIKNNGEYKDDPVCLDCSVKCILESRIIDSHNDKVDYVSELLKDACDKTIFSSDVRLKFALLNRKTKNTNKYHHLEKSIREIIKTEIIKQFEEQNYKLINKINKL